jgi:hypothetical protein
MIVIIVRLYIQAGHAYPPFNLLTRCNFDFGQSCAASLKRGGASHVYGRIDPFYVSNLFISSTNPQKAAMSLE